MKLFLSRSLLFVSLLAACALSPCRIEAQVANAQLNGTVTDSSGAVIPKATVLIVNTDVGITRTVTTGKGGEYSAPILPPGHYRITVQVPGFETLVAEHITLNVGDNKQLVLSLKVGKAIQQVTVDAGGLTINTTDGSVSTVIDRKFVANMPLNGRSFQDLISMTPGVLTNSPQTKNQAVGRLGDFSVNGQRTESNNYLIDGISGNISSGTGVGIQPASSGSIGGSTALGTTQSMVSVEDLQEFRVESSSYSAEYGRTPGGQFTFVTRSGSNSFHGSAFDYLRNNYFDANDWFNDYFGVPIPALRQNDFGGTLGGPVWIPKVYDGKNRSFFFVSYEGLRLMQPQAASAQYVPDANIRQQAPSVLQPLLNAFPIQTGPEEYVPCGTTYGYPCPAGIPTGTPAPSGLALFAKAYSVPSTIDSTSVRVDHNLGPKLALFFRFSDTPSSTNSRNLSTLQLNQSNAQTYTLGATSQLSDKVTNEFRLGYSRSDASLNWSLDSFSGATPVNLSTLVGLGAYSSTNATLEDFVSGVGTAELETGPTGNLGRQWNLTDTINTSWGHHQMKMGFYYRHIKSVSNPSAVGATAIFESANSVLNNSVDYLAASKSDPSTPLFNEIALFIQDEWRVRSRLSVSLGLRWELDPPPTEQHGNDAYTISGNLSNPSTITLAPLGTPLWKTTYYDLAPRFGVAWQAHTKPGWETVVRTGGGVFFDTANEVATLGFQGFGYQAVESYAAVPLPVTANQLAFAPSAAPPYTSYPIFAFPDRLQLPYTLQWNAAVQQGIGRAQALTLSYVGANGRRLLQYQEVNLAKLNPDFGEVYEFPGNLTSSYNAMQVEFQRSVANGVQALASYTWSHSLDFGSTYTTFPLTRGNSDFDVRSNFQAGLSWELPHAKSTQLAQAILNGWGLDSRVLARTAYPITILGTLKTDPATGNEYYTGANLVPGVPVYLSEPNSPGGRVVNKAAFSVPTGTEEGDAPRNFVRGFGESQINFAVRRVFTLHEGVTLQFRAETFNLLNHPNFGYVDPTLTDATFGQATQTVNESLATLASQYQQGGPRSMQFALRLAF